MSISITETFEWVPLYFKNLMKSLLNHYIHWILDLYVLEQFQGGGRGEGWSRDKKYIVTAYSTGTDYTVSDSENESCQLAAKRVKFPVFFGEAGINICSWFFFQVDKLLTRKCLLKYLNFSPIHPLPTWSAEESTWFNYSRSEGLITCFLKKKKKIHKKERPVEDLISHKTMAGNYHLANGH